MRQLLSFIILFFAIHNSYAQFASYGTDPASVKYMQINTENFQIIYPKDYDSVANMFANKLETVYNSVSKSLNHQPKKISVLLHNKSTMSNAFVVWAPSRMEIFDTPSQNEIAQDWFDLLAIHEFRHVVQTDKMNQGITRILYFLLGEQGIGLVLGAYVPLWYLEGDAVCTETAFSKSGRGRQADFSKGLRAQFHQKKIFSYDKATFGSYREHVPNHYEMGYHLVAGTRQKYSQNVWNNTLDRVAKMPYTFTPFNRGIKKETNLSKVELYNEIFEHQKTVWNLEYKREGQSPFDTITRQKTKGYTNYLYARRMKDGSIIAEKTSYTNIPYIVKIDTNGNETRLAHVSFKNRDESFSSNDYSLVWTEKNHDTRWEHANTTDIITYSLITNKISKIKTKQRVFAPTVSPYGNKIIAVLVDEKSNHCLALYNTGTKKEVERFYIPNNEFPQMPSFNSNGSSVVFTSISKKGKRILELNLATKSFTEILPYTFEDVANPIYWEDCILYSSSYSGVDNIYAINKQSKEISRITAASFNTKYPSVLGNKLMFSDYSSYGYIIGEKDMRPHSWSPIDVIKKARYDLAQTLSYQEGKPINFNHSKDSVYSTKKYRRATHLFNLHSWFPAYLQFNKSVTEPGFGIHLLSQNKLSTMQSSAGVRVSPGVETFKAFGKFTYSGIYPIISFEASKGYQHEEYSNDFIKTIEANFKTAEVLGYITVPLNLSSRSFYRSLDLSASASYNSMRKIFETETNKPEVFIDNLNTTTFGAGVSFKNVRASSYRDIISRCAQSISIGYLHSPEFSLINYSDLAYGNIGLYLPGIIKNHSIKFAGAYQWNKDFSIYNFYNKITLPRGYKESIVDNKQAYSASIQYTLPLFYPDFAAGLVFYLKRIYANVFADYTVALSSNKFMLPTNADFYANSYDYYSFGYELMFNLHVFRTLPELSVGLRHSFLPKEEKLQSFQLMFDFKI